jgi:hypothetical protein
MLRFPQEITNCPAYTGEKPVEEVVRMLRNEVQHKKTHVNIQR